MFPLWQMSGLRGFLGCFTSHGITIEQMIRSIFYILVNVLFTLENLVNLSSKETQINLHKIP